MSYFKFINNETQEPICIGYGYYRYTELNGIDLEDTPFISMDGTYFFNIKGCDKYSTSIADPETDESLEFNTDKCEGIDIISSEEFSYDHFNAIIKRSANADLTNLVIQTSGWKEVIDKASGEVIARGPVTTTKTEHCAMRTQTPLKPLTHYVHAPSYKCSLISFDNKHYFWTEGGLKYDVRCTEDHTPIEYVEREDYTQCLWREEFDVVRKADVIREFSIDECDPEIQGLVYALNKIPGIETLVSCCGHNSNYAWVSMKCTSQGITLLFNILRDYTTPYFNKFWVDPTSHTIDPRNNTIERNGPMKDVITFLSLITYDKGQDAYDALDALAKTINDQFGGPEND